MIRKITPIIISLLISIASTLQADEATGNVIFLHPDGTGLGHWNIARLVTVGPDGMSNWDKVERMAAYRPHQKGWLMTTSHAGATTHAYGKKVDPNSYGLDRETPITALSGKPMSIMHEAMKEGLRVGIINTGHIAEPGTGVFLASSKSRWDMAGIADKIMSSGADLIFCAGEIYLLPEGTVGEHGKPGVREDGRNLLNEARENGYTVIYTRDELLNLPEDTDKVIGVFAADNTYNDQPEAALIRDNLPLYKEDAPTYAEMTKVALAILNNQPDTHFFLMAEEEATDNFSNQLNAAGMIEALTRADAAVGVAREFVQQHPDTLLLVTADSDAAHPTVYSKGEWDADTLMPEITDTGAPVDSRYPERRPFLTKPDSFGKVHGFGIAWPSSGDGLGSAIAKAEGFGSEYMTTTFDNTEAYRLCYRVLFGKVIE